jgi:hypothetical protein
MAALLVEVSRSAAMAVSTAPDDDVAASATKKAAAAWVCKNASTAGTRPALGSKAPPTSREVPALELTYDTSAATAASADGSLSTSLSSSAPAASFVFFFFFWFVAEYRPPSKLSKK